MDLLTLLQRHPTRHAWRAWLICGAVGTCVDVAAADANIDVRLVEDVDEGVDGDVRAAVELVLDAAAKAWQRCLSGLPQRLDVAITARFAGLPCDSERMVAARAQTKWVAQGDRLMPLPLVAYGQGERLDAEAGLEIELSRALLSPTGCNGASWSTAVPVEGSLVASNGPELFAAVQHELGHVLGLDVGYDVLAPPQGASSVYLQQLFSNVHAAPLADLTLAQRRDAVRTPRNVVWTGGATRTLAASVLDSGVAEIYLVNPDVTDQTLGGLFGSDVRLVSRGERADQLIEGRLAVVTEPCGATQPRDGVFAVVQSPSCGVAAAVTNLIRDGAVGVVVEGVDWAEPEHAFPVPVVASEALRLTQLVEARGPIEVLFRVNSARLRGADRRGRPYVHTPQDYDPAVSLVHLERDTVSFRRASPTSNVPELGAGVDATCGLAYAMLLDLGYAKPACGDGTVGPDETCDDGADNSDVRPNACRRSCQTPACGDAVTDDGEACDDGTLNSLGSDACRPDCTAPYCGDGVVDLAHGERCDEGSYNSDERPDACRTHCSAASCGDGVVDGGEECDDGPENADDVADRCRTDCTLPRCGDGVIDVAAGETCDDGNTLPGPWCDDACRRPDELEDNALGDAGQDAGPDAGHEAIDVGGLVPTSTLIDAAVRVPASDDHAAPGAGCGCYVGARGSTRGTLAVLSGFLLVGIVRRRARRDS